MGVPRAGDEIVAFVFVVANAASDTELVGQRIGERTEKTECFAVLTLADENIDSAGRIERIAEG